MDNNTLDDNMIINNVDSETIISNDITPENTEQVNNNFNSNNVVEHDSQTNNVDVNQNRLNNLNNMDRNIELNNDTNFNMNNINNVNQNMNTNTMNKKYKLPLIVAILILCILTIVGLFVILNKDKLFKKKVNIVKHKEEKNELIIKNILNDLITSNNKINLKIEDIVIDSKLNPDTKMINLIKKLDINLEKVTDDNNVFQSVLNIKLGKDNLLNLYGKLEKDNIYMNIDDLFKNELKLSVKDINISEFNVEDFSILDMLLMISKYETKKTDKGYEIVFDLSDKNNILDKLNEIKDDKDKIEKFADLVIKNRDNIKSNFNIDLGKENKKSIIDKIQKEDYEPLANEISKLKIKLSFFLAMNNNNLTNLKIKFKTENTYNFNIVLNLKIENNLNTVSKTVNTSKAKNMKIEQVLDIEKYLDKLMKIKDLQEFLPNNEMNTENVKVNKNTENKKEEFSYKDELKKGLNKYLQLLSSNKLVATDLTKNDMQYTIESHFEELKKAVEIIEIKLNEKKINGKEIIEVKISIKENSKTNTYIYNVGEKNKIIEE